MKIETDWAKIPLGFYLRREIHKALAKGKGGAVYTLQVKISDEAPYDQPHVPGYQDSWNPGTVTARFWGWAKSNLPIFDAPARVHYSEQ